MKSFLAVVVLTVACSAQVIQINAGTSTLGQSSTGLTLSAFMPSSTATLSGGVQNGHVVFGSSDAFDIGKTSLLVGTQQLSQYIEGAGVSVTGVGVSAQRGERDNSVGIFAGTVGVGYFMPYIRSAVPQHIGGGMFARHRYGRLRLGAIALDEGRQRTGVASAAWRSQRLTATAVGGVLNNSGYFSGDASYRLLKPLTFFGGHVSTVTPIRSTSDDAGASFNVSRFSVTAMAMRSAATRTVSGKSVSVGTTFGPVRNYVAVTQSGQQKMLIDTMYEQVSRHWTAQQMVTRSNGNTNVGFGGSYTSNRVSFGVDYGVAFVPQAQQAFQRTVSVHINVSIHGTQMTAQTVMIAGLKPLYQISGERWVQGPIATQGSHGVVHASSGKYHVTGIVTDVNGNGLEGVAVIVGKDILYSNTTGHFNTSTKKAKPQSIRIDLDQSTVIGDWKVKEIPASVVPTEDDTTIHVVLIRP
jgi:hypothetical protein